MRKLVAAVVVAGVGVVAMAGAAQAAPPTADSGPSVEVRVGEPAQLHGSASDPDGDAVQIRWLRSAFNGGVLASCTFTGPTGFQPISDAGLNPTLTCTQPGDYLMQLVAADGTSSFDSVGALVTVTPNHPPVADSGPDVAAVVGGVAQLQGAVSDPDGDDLEIRWIRSVVSGASLANCTFSGPTSFQPVTPAGLAPTMSCSQPLLLTACAEHGREGPARREVVPRSRARPAPQRRRPDRQLPRRRRLRRQPERAAVPLTRRERPPPSGGDRRAGQLDAGPLELVQGGGRRLR